MDKTSYSWRNNNIIRKIIIIRNWPTTVGNLALILAIALTLLTPLTDPNPNLMSVAYILFVSSFIHIAKTIQY